MNQKDLSVFVNFPKKIRIMILDQNFYNFYLKKSCRSSLSELIFKKYISEILEYTLFKYKQYFYKQRQAVKQKAKQHHQAELGRSFNEIIWLIAMNIKTIMKKRSYD